VAAATSPGAASGQPSFLLIELRVLGNTVLDAKSIEQTLIGYLGPNRSLADVEAARAALEGAYHERGFGTVFVDIPEQSVGADGIVRLRVTEAHVRASAIQNERYTSEREIRQAVPEAAPGTVPNLPLLQAQINAANAQSSDSAITPVLKAGPVPGTVDLALKVQDHLPFHGSLELNNQYAAGTSSLRASAVLSYDNFFDRHDSLSVQYQESPKKPSEVAVFAASYVARLGSAQNKLSATYIDSSSSVTTVGALGVLGKGKVYSLRYIHSLAATPSAVTQLVIGADLKDFSQDVLVSPDSRIQTPIRYISFTASYGATLRRPQRLWAWSSSYTLGVNGLGATAQQFADKCYECRPNFSVLRMDGSLRQTLPRDFSVIAQLAGQYSATPVISNEQLYIGGAQSVRGYYEAEELGDAGLRAALELHAPQVAIAEGKFSADPYLFGNYGRIKYQAPLIGQPTAASLRSLGAGLGLSAWNTFVAQLTWAYPLVDGSQTKRGQQRVEFVLRSSW
jgi:hemolysin activation/secretion protein